jgi:hypothetical protein
MIEEILSKNFLNLEKVAKDNKNKFLNNIPFSHISFDNFFKTEFLDTIIKIFPDLEKNKNITKFNSERDKNKIATNLNFNYPKEINNFLNDLNSYKFLKFLQELTSIKETLIPDPYYFGGGLHEIKKNGFLKVHADFNYHPDLQLDRRVNILIYLNKNWKSQYGGELELWDKNMNKCQKKYLPEFNRLVIFNTNDFTYHGHPEPLNCPDELSRKSIALYYYSNGRPKEEVNNNLRYHNTIYRNRKNFNEDLDERIPVYKKLFGKIYIRKKINS